MILRCIIIDDEPLARKGLKEYIQDLGFLQLAGEFDNPIKAIDTILQQKADLLFLDIQMPKMTGVDFLKTLSHPPMIIFTTAYPQYAVEGFELNAIDYLVKPFSFDRFCKSVMKARKLKESSMQAPTENADPQKDYFFLKSDNKLMKIRFDEILFVEALQNYIAIQTTGKKHIAYLTFHGIEAYLPADRFIRTHKSFIVAADKIESIEGNDIRIGPHHIPISRTERDSVLRQLLDNRLPKR
ncbi:MAG TPA: LytTR family DNA-binding domain-containing protein [Puia sp.]|nr:LytTR family DNA-binding domain-containing protein [Puia sp.]